MRDSVFLKTSIPIRITLIPANSQNKPANKYNSDYPFMHLLYSQLLVCQRVCLQNTVCLICK